MLNRHAFEVEEIDEKKGDVVLDIDIRPNRAPDAFSHLGVAREINAIIKAKELNYPPLKVTAATFDEKLIHEHSKGVEIKIDNSEDCRRYTALVVENIAVGKSPDWLIKRLKAVGVEPINNVVDITNYVMLTLGQPIHAFDYDKLKQDGQSGNVKIIVRRAQHGEEIKALDGVTYKLSPNILLIASPKKALAIAGIKGGEEASITSYTKRVLLEAANFDSTLIYQASKKLRLKTDASTRFSHSVPLELTPHAINMAARLLGELAGGRTTELGADSKTEIAGTLNKITVSTKKISAFLGVELSRAHVKNIMAGLGSSVEEKDGALIIQPPYFRKDLVIFEDIAEEVGRLYGYDNIPADTPFTSLAVQQHDPFFLIRMQIKKLLTGFGYSQVYLYSMVNKSQARYGGAAPDDLDNLALINPISSERAYLRPSLLPGLAEAVQENLKNFDQVKIFETGKIFKLKNKGGLSEEWALALAVASKNSSAEKTIQEVKGVLAGLSEALGFNDIEFRLREKAPLMPIFGRGHDLDIYIENEPIGVIGLVNYQLQQELDLKTPVVVAELELEHLVSALEKSREYQKPPRYPAVLRDISILVPESVKVGQVLNIIHRVGKELIEDVDLFDIYQGEKIGAGIKSLAFHIIYRSLERTLKAKEVNELHEKICEALKNELGAEIR